MIRLALILVLAQTDGGPLSSADLAAYREALKPSDQPASSVGFLDLWEHPDTHRGQHVRLSGRFARQFRQPSTGEFPALSELWLSTPAGNLFCVVFPTPRDPVAPSGETLEFEGTFLRLVRYSSGDVPRLAPLVVGPKPPRKVLEAASEPSTPWIYWIVGGAFVSLAGLTAAYLHMRGSSPVRLPPDPGERGA